MKKERNILMWILLVFLPPIGIAYMWIRKKNLTKRRKIIYTIVFAIWTIYIIAVNASSDTETKPQGQTEIKQETVSKETVDKTEKKVKKNSKKKTSKKSYKESSKKSSNMDLYGVDAIEVVGDLLQTPAFTAEPKTTKMTDQIALTAKANAEKLNDDQVNAIINDIKTVNHNFYTDEASMLKYMWYGYLLDYKFEDSNARSSLGQDVFQAVKNVYRGTDTLESDSTQANFSQIDKSLRKIAEESMTLGQKNALSKAYSYLDFTAFSYSGLIEQLQYEGFTPEESTFAVDNCGADWNEQSAKKAQSYMEFQSFSRDGLIEQLLYEGFTQEQAEYGVSSVGY